MLRFSIITVCYNSQATLARTVMSVRDQSYPWLEHLLVDGDSSDGTLALAAEILDCRGKIYSEPDKGIYDAMCKGFSMSSGDIISFLNSDDAFYDPTVLATVAEVFSDPSVDYVYGDLIICDGALAPRARFVTGPVNSGGGKYLTHQIPHPVLFLRRSTLGAISPPFDPSYRISADLKQQLIFHGIHGAKGFYVAKPLALMRAGGKSNATLHAKIMGLAEAARAYREVFGIRYGIAIALLKAMVNNAKRLPL